MNKAELILAILKILFHLLKIVLIVKKILL